MSALISWNSNFSLWPSLISLPEPIIRLFFPFLLSHLSKRCISAKERQKLWSPSVHFLFQKSHAASYPPPPRTTEGLRCSRSTEWGGQTCGCSMEIKRRVFSLGPCTGHLKGRGGRRDGCGNNLSSFSEGSEVTRLREFILSACYFKPGAHRGEPTGSGCSWKYRIIGIDVNLASHSSESNPVPDTCERPVCHC